MSSRAAASPPPPSRSARRGESADHFRLMAEHAPVMIWLAAPDRKCVYVNQPWLEFTGRALDRELGLGWIEGIHPEDRAGFLDTYASAFTARAPFDAEFRLRRRDGQFRWLVDRGVPLLDGEKLIGFAGSCVDLTDRMLAEQAARKREEDFKTLAQNIPDVIARFDRDLRCLYVNRAVQEAFRLEPAQCIGQRVGELRLPPPMLAPASAALRKAFDTEHEQRFEFSVETAGQRRHFVGRVMPERGVQGRVDAVLAIIYDDTARAIEGERSAQLLARERSARADAESATLARDQFLAIVSHELRSPLNGIKSWTHVLENQLRDADPATKRALAGIMIGVEHQVRLIDDLLDVTRAMSGNLGLAKQPMPVLPVLADAVESLRALALEKALVIATDYGIGDREIHGDPDRIRQIFVNLLSNAVKFTPSGGTIWVATRVEGAMACVEVRDNGVGISHEFLPYLFDPFRQADQGSSSRGHEGLGLGLALVRRLAELHGGHATCESKGPDQGATFRVYLPLRREAAGRVLVDPAQPAQSVHALPSLTGVRVLLIDDQREARESLATLLTQAGASVEAAASGREALRLLDRGEEGSSPEVIVCDIAMPDEDGYETLKRIRQWETSHGTAASIRRPVVALSAFTQRADRIRALSEGFQMHLTKPVAPAELITVISSVARGMRV
jgi:PAS domain S-box-containing protein